MYSRPVMASIELALVVTIASFNSDIEMNYSDLDIRSF